MYYVFCVSTTRYTHTTVFYFIYFSMLHCVQHFTHIKFYIHNFSVQSSWHVYILTLQVLALTALLYFFIYFISSMKICLFCLLSLFCRKQQNREHEQIDKKRQTKQTEVLNNAALKFVYNSVRKNAYHKMIFA